MIGINGLLTNYQELNIYFGRIGGMKMELDIKCNKCDKDMELIDMSVNPINYSIFEEYSCSICGSTILIRYGFKRKSLE